MCRVSTDMGAMPDRLPGYQSVADPEVHDRFEKSWNVTFPRTRGLDNHEMVDAIFEGKLKAMYLYGEEMSLVDANANLVGDAFSKLEFFVVQEIFFSDTCRYADVILPAAPSLEKEGTFTNTEARIQRLHQVFEPLAESTAGLANHSGGRQSVRGKLELPASSEIMREIASLTPFFAGVTYERLEGYQTLQWPVHPDGTDEPLLFTKGFNFPDGKARFFPVGWIEPYEQVDAEFDLQLNNGRLLEHFHEGNMTYRVNGIKEKTPNTLDRDFARPGRRTKDRHWALGGVELSPWPGSSPRSW